MQPKCGIIGTRGDRTVIYIDVLIFVNCILNYIVLYTTACLLHYRYKTLRLVAASFVGSLTSLIIFCDFCSGILSVLFRAGSGILIAWIAFGYYSIKELFKKSLAVILSSVVFAGMMMLVYEWLKPPNMVIIKDIVYFDIHPLTVIALSAAIYGIIRLCQYLFSERIKNTVVTLRFEIDETSYSCTAKVDTGCNAREPFSGAPIIIVSRTILNTDDMPDIRVIPYSTVNSASLLFGIRAHRVWIDDSEIDKTVYICSADSFRDPIYAVINSDILR